MTSCTAFNVLSLLKDSLFPSSAADSFFLLTDILNKYGRGSITGRGYSRVNKNNDGILIAF